MQTKKIESLNKNFFLCNYLSKQKQCYFQPKVQQLVKQFRVYDKEELKRQSVLRTMAYSIEKLQAGKLKIKCSSAQKKFHLFCLLKLNTERMIEDEHFCSFDQ